MKIWNVDSIVASNRRLIGIRRDAVRLACISGSTTLMQKFAQQNQSVEVLRALSRIQNVTILGNLFQRHCHLSYQNQEAEAFPIKQMEPGVQYQGLPLDVEGFVKQIEHDLGVG